MSDKFMQSMARTLVQAALLGDFSKLGLAHYIALINVVSDEHMAVLSRREDEYRQKFLPKSLTTDDRKRIQGVLDLKLHWWGMRRKWQKAKAFYVEIINGYEFLAYEMPIVTVMVTWEVTKAKTLTVEEGTDIAMIAGGRASMLNIREASEVYLDLLVGSTKIGVVEPY